MRSELKLDPATLGFTIKVNTGRLCPKSLFSDFSERGNWNSGARSGGCEIWSHGTPGGRAIARGERGKIYVGTQGLGRVYEITDNGKERSSRVVVDKLNQPAVTMHKGSLYVMALDKQGTGSSGPAFFSFHRHPPSSPLLRSWPCAWRATGH